MIKKNARSYSNIKDYKFAIEYFEKSLIIYKNIFGMNHAKISHTLKAIARIFTNHG